MPSASCNADTGTNGITWPRKSSYASFQLSWPKKCNSAIDDAVGIMWCWSQWCHKTKRHVAYHFNCLYLKKQLCHLWCCWHHVTLILTPVTSCNTNTNCIIWCQCQWQLCHDTKKVMLYVIWLSWPKEFNGDIENADSIMWCQHQCQWHFMTRKVLLHLIWSAGYKECKGAIDHAINIMWCWCWCQWCNMTKCNVAFHFDHLDLRSAMVTWTMPFALHGADASANGIIWWRKLCCTSLLASWPKKIMCNLWFCKHHMTLTLMSMTSHDTKTNGIMWC